MPRKGPEEPPDLLARGPPREHRHLDPRATGRRKIVDRTHPQRARPRQRQERSPLPRRKIRQQIRQGRNREPRRRGREQPLTSPPVSQDQLSQLLPLAPRQHHQGPAPQPGPPRAAPLRGGPHQLVEGAPFLLIEGREEAHQGRRLRAPADPLEPTDQGPEGLRWRRGARGDQPDPPRRHQPPQRLLQRRRIHPLWPVDQHLREAVTAAHKGLAAALQREHHRSPGGPSLRISRGEIP